MKYDDTSDVVIFVCEPRNFQVQHHLRVSAEQNETLELGFSLHEANIFCGCCSFSKRVFHQFPFATVQKKNSLLF